jgi:cell division topological specificity factor
MIEFLRRLFGQQGSSATAKERLRLVLMTDHLELAPEMIDTMKRELVDVISRYVEVDRERIEVSFERQDRTLAMLANIPILAVNRPNGNGAVAHEDPQPAADAVAQPPAPVAPEAPAEETPQAQSGAPPRVRRRKRRKKAQNARANLPSTA